ncbi:hypothetical protein HDU67_010362, partial [Dinochytrium kinnereticum]
MSDSALSTGLLAGIAVGLVAGVVGVLLAIWWLWNYAYEYYIQYRDRDKHETGSSVMEAADLAAIRRRQTVKRLEMERTRSKKPVYRMAGENGVIALADDVEGSAMVVGSITSSGNNNGKNLHQDRQTQRKVNVPEQAATSTVEPKTTGGASNDPLAWFQRMLPISAFNRNANAGDEDTNSTRDSLVPPPRPAYNELSVEALKRFGLEVSPERLPRSFTTAPGDALPTDQINPTANDDLDGFSLPHGSTMRMMEQDHTVEIFPSSTPPLAPTQPVKAHIYPPLAVDSRSEKTTDTLSTAISSTASPVVSASPIPSPTPIPSPVIPVTSTPSAQPADSPVHSFNPMGSAAPITLRVPLRGLGVSRADTVGGTASEVSFSSVEKASRHATTNTTPTRISTVSTQASTVYRGVGIDDGGAESDVNDASRKATTQSTPASLVSSDIAPSSYRPADPSAAILSRSRMTKMSTATESAPPIAVQSYPLSIPAAFDTPKPLQRTASLSASTRKILPAATSTSPAEEKSLAKPRSPSPGYNKTHAATSQLPTHTPSIVYLPRESIEPRFLNLKSKDDPPSAAQTALLVAEAQAKLEAETVSSTNEALLEADENAGHPSRLETASSASSAAWSWAPSVRPALAVGSGSKVPAASHPNVNKEERRVVVPPMQRRQQQQKEAEERKGEPEFVRGLIGIATVFYRGPEKQDVDLFPGNTVIIFEAFEDGMGYGVNRTTMTGGLIPLRLVTFATSDEFPDGIFVPLKISEVVTWK